MPLHLYLTKYKTLYRDFNNISEKVKQKIRDIIAMNSKYNLFAENLLIKQVSNNFLLIFWDDERICAYFVNAATVIMLEFPDLDYSDKLLYKEFVDIKNEFVIISFRYKKDDFSAMIAPIAVTYGFHMDKLSNENIVVGEVGK